jgi:ribosomal protein L32
MTKGKDLENEYFMREDLANKHKAEQEKMRQQKKQHDQELQALHFMKCPKCGHDLETKRMSYIDVDQCSSCGAIVLAHDDIDRFVAEEKSILKVLIDFFK